ncbi:hypothetical protein NEIRO03_1038 [Nematocida sp. AWRm78]|nr:hypothetical protein NEIRO02_1076 [Nematocida sp. AWRm79]KAI5183442.1 hypothetical protein NEIRO03_1038 [Nematocida sp. AWRm78]
METQDIETQMSEKTIFCRICTEPETSENRLASPCKCIGNMKYVHSACILEWIYKTRTQICNFCNYKMRLKRVYINKPTESNTYPVYTVIYIYSKIQSMLLFGKEVKNKIFEKIEKGFAYLTAVVLDPIYRLFSLSMLPAFMSIPRLIAQKNISNIRKQDTYTIIDTLTKLNVITEYNTMYSEIHSNSTRIHRAGLARAHAENDIQRIFSIIIFEDDLEGSLEIVPTTVDYIVLFISLGLVSWVSYILNPTTEYEGDAWISKVLIPAATLLWFVYTVIFLAICLQNRLGMKRGSRYMNICGVYCKLLIILLARYGALPYFIFHVVEAMLYILYANIKMNALQVFIKQSVYSIIPQISEVFNKQMAEEIAQSASEFTGFLFVILGNIFLFVFQSVYARYFSHIIRPGLFGWICPMSVSVNRVIKDRIFTTFQSYTIAYILFTCACIVLCVPILFLEGILLDSHFWKIPCNQIFCLENMTYLYFYLPIIEIFYNGPLQSYFSYVKSILSSISRRVSRCMKVESLLFNGDLPNNSVNLSRLCYLPARNDVSYTNEEIVKRRMLKITKEEKELYFDENGKKKRITMERFTGLEADEHKWTESIVNATRAELLYNPAYSIFYVPSFAVVRVILFSIILFSVCSIITVITGLLLYSIVLYIEYMREEIMHMDILNQIFYTAKLFLGILCIAGGMLCLTYRERKFLIVRKIYQSVKKDCAIWVIPFIVVVFGISLKESIISLLGYKYAKLADWANAPFQIWFISYTLGLDLIFRNDYSLVFMLVEGACMFILYTMIDIFLFKGTISKISIWSRLCIVLFPYVFPWIVNILERIGNFLCRASERVKSSILSKGTEIVLVDA